MRKIPQMCALAKVTSKGIRFLGLNYSCERAIKERWFEYARLYGGWTIQVVFNPNDLTKIYHPLEVEVECCRIILPQEYKGSKLEKYFRSIQALRSERRRIINKRRSSGTIID